MEGVAGDEGEEEGAVEDESKRFESVAGAEREVWATPLVMSRMGLVATVAALIEAVAGFLLSALAWSAMGRRGQPMECGVRALKLTQSSLVDGELDGTDGSASAEVVL